MEHDPRVQRLFEELLDAELTPEEVCRDCPELLPQVRTRWNRKLACDAHLDMLFPAIIPISLADASRPACLAADPLHIPGYEIHGVLGHGGMGVVYKARQLRLGRTVALKMLRADARSNPEHWMRFIQEAEAVAGLRHPNIVQVHDMGNQDGRPYFSMEFLEGGNLAQKLAGTPQPPDAAAALVAILADAVGTAHKNGIVHRDLKPSNVLLSTDGTPKISDFGLARRIEDGAGLTRPGTAVGTPSYMAPEQARGEWHTSGFAVDIYSLGAILYEMVTGRPPFRAETAEETVRQVISGDLVLPSQLDRKIPCDLETICLKCLHREPSLRYADAAALATDLHRFLGGEAILARPEGRIARLVRFVRPRAMRVAGTLFTITLLAGGLWLFYDRTMVAWSLEADRRSAERAADEDLRELAKQLNSSSWPEARVALDRAKARLGDSSSTDLRRRLEQSSHDLELGVRLESIRMDPSRGLIDFTSPRPAEQYEQVFREIGEVRDNPVSFAERILASSLRRAMIDALDDWSICTTDTSLRSWILTVARKADPDPTGWRDRARDPAVQGDQTALIDVIKAAPVSDRNVPLFLALDRLLNRTSPERLRYLKRIHQEHPSDFWVNYTVGEVLLLGNQPEEAIRYYQAAVSIRPELPLTHHYLGQAMLGAERMEEAVRHLRLAAEIEPRYFLSHQLLAFALSELGIRDEAVNQLRIAIRHGPSVAILYSDLARCLESTGNHTEALVQHRKAVELDPSNPTTQRELRNFLARQGHGDEARVKWKASLEDQTYPETDWHAYTEFCLFIGAQDEYRRARKELLARYGMSNDPSVMQRTARACLLLSAPEDELRPIVRLAERAAMTDRQQNQAVNPYYLFVKGLAEYRDGKFERAVSSMRGVPGPAANLVLAMALHRLGQFAEARKTLAAAIIAHDWRSIRIRDHNDWFLHVLRREAERLIISDLPDFLNGTYRPRDNDERLALLGICQCTNRLRLMARLYSDAFATSPQLAIELWRIHRYAAFHSVVMVGSGRDNDGGKLGEDERKRWRTLAHNWLDLELSEMERRLDAGSAADRHRAWRVLTYCRADPDLADIREPDALNRLSAGEREEWIAAWKRVDAILMRAASP